MTTSLTRWRTNLSSKSEYGELSPLTTGFRSWFVSTSPQIDRASHQFCGFTALVLVGLGAPLQQKLGAGSAVAATSRVRRAVDPLAPERAQGNGAVHGEGGWGATTVTAKEAVPGVRLDLLWHWSSWDQFRAACSGSEMAMAGWFAVRITSLSLNWCPMLDYFGSQ